MDILAFLFPQFAVTNQSTNSVVTALVGGTPSNPLSFLYPQTWNTTQDQNLYATIHWRVPPRLDVIDYRQNVGLAEGTSVLYSSATARASFTPFDPNSGGSGEDFLGRGIFLENGWVVQPLVMWAHSYQDSPNYTVPCDSNRCAKIEALPQNGRIEVKVAWSFAPGESIDYQVGWGVAGPYGLRPYNTVSKQSTCAGEQ